MASLSFSLQQNPVFRTLTRLLYRRTISLLTLLLIAGSVAALWNMSRLSTTLMKAQAIQNSRMYVQALQEARTYYSARVLKSVKDVDGVEIHHDQAEKPNSIPVPATYLIDLSHRLTTQTDMTTVRLYSDKPFPWREDGGAHDEFEREALAVLMQAPEAPFYRFENMAGERYIRYAVADVLKPSCVECHNRPDSPKPSNNPEAGWKAGDVRGVLEIITPLSDFAQQAQQRIKSTGITLTILFGLAVAGLVLVIGRLRNVSRELEQQVQNRTADLRKANRQLERERRKSENLLLNILPPSIAARLKAGHREIADGFADATVLFADLVNFTQLAETRSPHELVQLLNTIFSAFDALTERFGLEKIKTIGDAYMVVGGLPVPRPDHAEAIAELALAMQQEVKRLCRQTGESIEIRIGINTGPVTAGVIGTKKFIYDLWGDTVNVASRMESHGLAGAIQVSETTYERLRHRYQFSVRRNVSVKGKGAMTTYVLTENRQHTNMQSRSVPVSQS
ncbi:MAG: adenylate/guanylate cyclase domain-containing protein [Elainellaceae cyanobacterium]